MLDVLACVTPSRIAPVSTGMGGSGFPLHHVLSDNVDEFTCKICSEFCEQPVVTLCKNKHIFCLACLDEWFRNDAKCPTCQEHTAYGTDARYETLKEHSPVLSLSLIHI